MYRFAEGSDWRLGLGWDIEKISSGAIRKVLVHRTNSVMFPSQRHPWIIEQAI